MELIKKSIKYYGRVMNRVSVHDECSDMVVPDAFPDVMRVVFASGNVLIKDKSAQSDRVLISGVVKATVLYVPEDGVGIKRLEIPITFAHFEEGKGITQDSVIFVKAYIRNMETKMINSRKISVCAYIVFHIMAFNQNEAQLISGINASPDEGVQVMTTQQNVELNTAVAEKNLSITDELEMPEGYPSVCEILNAEAAVENEEVKVLNNKVIVRGTVDFNAMCLSANEPGFINWMAQMPFSQIIEMPGVEENSSVNTSFAMKNADFNLLPDSNGRKAEGSAQLTIFAAAQKEEKLQLATDAYSTAYEMTPQYETYNAPITADRQTIKKEFKDGFPEELGATGIVTCTVGLDGFNLSQELPDTIESTAYAQVLYYGHEGGLYHAAKKIPIAITSDKAKIDSMYSGKVIGIGADVRGDGGINISFTVEVMIENQKVQKIEFIANAQMAEARSNRKRGKASVVIRSPQENETLWDIAKSYKSTMAEIKNANKLEADDITAGQLLLIPFSR